MITSTFQTLWESIHHRVGLALLLIAAGLGLGHMALIRVGPPSPKGDVMVHLAFDERSEPAAVYAADYFHFNAEMTSFIWVLFSIFATSPLLATFLQRGWVEMLLSKGTSRVRILLGRLAGGALLYALTVTLLVAMPALHLSLRTGVSPARLFVALALSLLSYAAMFAVMSAIAISQPNAALLGIAGFCELMFSSALQQREALLAMAGLPRWVGVPLDVLYHLLPKHADLGQAAIEYASGGAFTGTAAVLSTAALLVGWSALACVQLVRRSF